MLFSLSLLLALTCLIPAVPKLGGNPRMRATAYRFEIDWPRYRLIGVAELAAAAGVLAGLVWRPIGLAAALCMALLLLGAIVMHVRVGDSARHQLPALVVLAIDALYLSAAFTM
jgi:DoxX-like protein